jgi:hypothetical protein
MDLPLQKTNSFFIKPMPSENQKDWTLFNGRMHYFYPLIHMPLIWIVIIFLGMNANKTNNFKNQKIESNILVIIMPI